MNYEIINKNSRVPIFAWVKKVGIDNKIIDQLLKVANLPFIFKHIAVMPDVHWGIGSTIGTIIPSINAIVPAAVGVDIGCGMIAVQTNLSLNNFPKNCKEIREIIEKKIPHGRTNHGQRGDRGAWHNIPSKINLAWEEKLLSTYKSILKKNPKIKDRNVNDINHLGTLGTGNHFIEICYDQNNQIWLMLHSGSRGIGNRIGSYFIDQAKKLTCKKKYNIKYNISDLNLSYFEKEDELFDHYMQAANWAQNYALLNRQLMVENLIEILKSFKGMPYFDIITEINCHHNYVSKEKHYGKEVFITRKGAIRARKNELAIIPGSMGHKSYIVKGLEKKESFHSASHGAGRKLSRNEAKKRFNLDNHISATKDIECRKDNKILDETPMAYKDIDDVMESQKDLVEIAYQLKQIICIKG